MGAGTGTQIPYIIKFAIDDSDIRKSLSKIDWEEELGLDKGKIITDALKSDAKTASDTIERELGGTHIDWRKVLGADLFDQLEKHITQNIRGIRDNIKDLIKSGDLKGVQDAIDLIMQLAQSFKELGGDFNAPSLFKALNGLTDKITEFENKVYGLEGALKRIKTTFGVTFNDAGKVVKAASGIERLGKALLVMGSDKSAIKTLKGIEDEIDKIQSKATIKIKADIDEGELSQLWNEQLDALSEFDDLTFDDLVENLDAYKDKAKALIPILKNLLEINKKSQKFVSGGFIGESIDLGGLGFDEFYDEKEAKKAINKVISVLEEEVKKGSKKVSDAFEKLVTGLAEVEVDLTVTQGTKDRLKESINQYVEELNNGTEINTVKVKAVLDRIRKENPDKEIPNVNVANQTGQQSDEDKLIDKRITQLKKYITEEKKNLQEVYNTLKEDFEKKESSRPDNMQGVGIQKSILKKQMEDYEAVIEQYEALETLMSDKASASAIAEAWDGKGDGFALLRARQKAILTDTQKWKQEMVDAMRTDDLQFKWDGKVTDNLGNVHKDIQDYFNENEIALTINAEDIAEQLSDALQKKGISIGGLSGNIDPNVIAQILKAAGQGFGGVPVPTDDDKEEEPIVIEQKGNEEITKLTPYVKEIIYALKEFVKAEGKSKDVESAQATHAIAKELEGLFGIDIRKMQLGRMSEDKWLDVVKQMLVADEAKGRNLIDYFRRDKVNVTTPDGARQYTLGEDDRTIVHTLGAMIKNFFEARDGDYAKEFNSNTINLNSVVESFKKLVDKLDSSKGGKQLADYFIRALGIDVVRVKNRASNGLTDEKIAQMLQQALMLRDETGVTRGVALADKMRDEETLKSYGLKSGTGVGKLAVGFGKELYQLFDLMDEQMIAQAADIARRQRINDFNRQLPYGRALSEMVGIRTVFDADTRKPNDKGLQIPALEAIDSFMNNAVVKEFAETTQAGLEALKSQKAAIEEENKALSQTIQQYWSDHREEYEEAKRREDAVRKETGDYKYVDPRATELDQNIQKETAQHSRNMSKLDTINEDIAIQERRMRSVAALDVYKNARETLGDQQTEEARSAFEEAAFTFWEDSKALFTYLSERFNFKGLVSVLGQNYPIRIGKFAHGVNRLKEGDVITDVVPPDGRKNKQQSTDDEVVKTPEKFNPLQVEEQNEKIAAASKQTEEELRQGLDANKAKVAELETKVIALESMLGDMDRDAKLPSDANVRTLIDRTNSLDSAVQAARRSLQFNHPTSIHTYKMTNEQAQIVQSLENVFDALYQDRKRDDGTVEKSLWNKFKDAGARLDTLSNEKRMLESGEISNESAQKLGDRLQQLKVWKQFADIRKSPSTIGAGEANEIIALFEANGLDAQAVKDFKEFSTRYNPNADADGKMFRTAFESFFNRTTEAFDALYGEYGNDNASELASRWGRYIEILQNPAGLEQQITNAQSDKAKLEQQINTKKANADKLINQLEEEGATSAQQRQEEMQTLAVQLREARDVLYQEAKTYINILNDKDTDDHTKQVVTSKLQQTLGNLSRVENSFKGIQGSVNMALYGPEAANTTVLEVYYKSLKEEAELVQKIKEADQKKRSHKTHDANLQRVRTNITQLLQQIDPEGQKLDIDQWTAQYGKYDSTYTTKDDELKALQKQLRQKLNEQAVLIEAIRRKQTQVATSVAADLVTKYNTLFEKEQRLLSEIESRKSKGKSYDNVEKQLEKVHDEMSEVYEKMDESLQESISAHGFGAAAKYKAQLQNALKTKSKKQRELNVIEVQEGALNREDFKDESVKRAVEAYQRDVAKGYIDRVKQAIKDEYTGDGRYTNRTLPEDKAKERNARLSQADKEEAAYRRSLRVQGNQLVRVAQTKDDNGVVSEQIVEIIDENLKETMMRRLELATKKASAQKQVDDANNNLGLIVNRMNGAMRYGSVDESDLKYTDIVSEQHELTAQIEKKTKEKQRLTEEINSLKERVSTKQALKDIEDKKKERSVLTKEINELKKQEATEPIKAEIAEKQAHVKQLNQEIKTMRSQGAVKQIEDKEGRLGQLEEEIEFAERRHNNLEIKRAQLEKDAQEKRDARDAEKKVKDVVPDQGGTGAGDNKRGEAPDFIDVEGLATEETLRKIYGLLGGDYQPTDGVASNKKKKSITTADGVVISKSDFNSAIAKIAGDGQINDIAANGVWKELSKRTMGSMPLEDMVRGIINEQFPQVLGQVKKEPAPLKAESLNDVLQLVNEWVENDDRLIDDAVGQEAEELRQRNTAIEQFFNQQGFAQDGKKFYSSRQLNKAQKIGGGGKLTPEEVANNIAQRIGIGSTNKPTVPESVAVSVEPEIKPGAVAQEVQENVVETPATVDVKPETVASVQPDWIAKMSEDERNASIKTINEYDKEVVNGWKEKGATELAQIMQDITKEMDGLNKESVEYLQKQRELGRLFTIYADKSEFKDKATVTKQDGSTYIDKVKLAQEDELLKAMGLYSKHIPITANKAVKDMFAAPKVQKTTKETKPIIDEQQGLKELDERLNSLNSKLEQIIPLIASNPEAKGLADELKSEIAKVEADRQKFITESQKKSDTDKKQPEENKKTTKQQTDKSTETKDFKAEVKRLIAAIGNEKEKSPEWNALQNELQETVKSWRESGTLGNKGTTGKNLAEALAKQGIKGIDHTKYALTKNQLEKLVPDLKVESDKKPAQDKKTAKPVTTSSQTTSKASEGGLLGIMRNELAKDRTLHQIYNLIARNWPDSVRNGLQQIIDADKDKEVSAVINSKSGIVSGYVEGDADGISAAKLKALEDANMNADMRVHTHGDSDDKFFSQQDFDQFAQDFANGITKQVLKNKNHVAKLDMTGVKDINGLLEALKNTKHTFVDLEETAKKFGATYTHKTFGNLTAEGLQKFLGLSTSKASTRSGGASKQNEESPLKEFDQIHNRIQKYRGIFEYAKQSDVGYLMEGDDADFKAKDQILQQSLQAFAKIEAEGGDVKKALEDVRKAYNDTADAAVRLNQKVNQNKRQYSGTNELRSAQRQRDKIAGQYGVDWDTVDPDSMAGQYEQAYQGLLEKYNKYAEARTLNNAKNQEDLRIEAALVQKLGSKYASTMSANDRLKELSMQSGSFYTSTGKERQLGGFKAFSDDDMKHKVQAMKTYAISLYGAEAASFKLNQKTMTLEGTVRENNKTVHDVAVTYNEAAQGAYAYEKAERESLSGLPAFMKGLKEKTKAISQYIVSMTSIYKVTGEMRKGVQYIREIDKALTELKKVTNETEQTYDQFLGTAAKTAGKLGGTISQVTEATATFAKLGYSMEMAAEMAEAAIVYRNVGDGIESAEDAADSIISTLKGFGLEASEALRIVDRFNEVNSCLLIQ